MVLATDKIGVAIAAVVAAKGQNQQFGADGEWFAAKLPATRRARRLRAGRPLRRNPQSSTA